MAETETQAMAGATVPAAAPRQGEPCEHCGAPLASDQRYCLECGQRRGGPRVDYRHYMTAGEPGAGEPAPQPGGAEPPPGAEEPGKAQRDYAPLAAVGGIAVLGLMLLVGVLIGKGNDGGTASAPPVIRVPAVEGGAESGAGGKSSKNTGAEGLGLSGSAKKAKNGAGKGGSGGTGNAVKASEGDLEQLGETSGEDYVKQSENLPNEIATPGAPPPIDKSKPAGGGEGGGEVIK